MVIIHAYSSYSSNVGGFVGIAESTEIEFSYSLISPLGGVIDYAGI